VTIATHLSTVSPLRGLDAFGEGEREVLLGRDQQRDELAQLVTADVFRAGLLYGEPGVGKTSLLRAGLIPLLRDRNIVALMSETAEEPSASMATGLAAFGIQMQPNEAPVAFLARAVGNAVPGQQFLFVIDDVDRTCRTEHGIADLADLYAKVVGRAGGRARFLFACASDRIHMLAQLERRTGSLFPPSNRIELRRMGTPEAASVLEAMLSMSAISGDRALAAEVVSQLSRDGDGILPADLQIAALTLGARGITTADALHRSGGARDLASTWIHDACAASGNPRDGMRMLAELAEGPFGRYDAAAMAKRISLEPGVARHILDTLEARGVVIRGDFAGTSWSLRHEVLLPRVRELTASTRAAARRAYELLGSKTGDRARLTLPELRTLWREGISPVTPEEQTLVARSWRHYGILAAAAAAVPLLLLIIVFFSMRGRVYFDIQTRAGGEYVVLREGRAGLSGFHWMGFGNVTADTGLTRAMVAPEAWKRIQHRDLGDDADRAIAHLPEIVAPSLAGAIAYATTSSDQALDKLKKLAKEPEEVVEMLELLRPIGRGGRAETALIDGAIASPSPAVQRAAAAITIAAASRRPDAYTESLTRALASGNAEIRKIAIAELRNMPAERAARLVAAALAGEIDAAARRELTVAAASESAGDRPTPALAAAVLAEPTSTDDQKARARAQLRAALVNERGATVQVLAELATSGDARAFALEVLAELEPLPPAIDLTQVAQAAYDNKSEQLRTAALPLYARVSPDRAVAALTPLLTDKKASRVLQVAAAKAWGALVAVKPEVARPALETMLRSEISEVRAAAAAAYGRIGRPSQEPLVKMVKNERFEVSVGAGLGLAASAEEGGSVSVAIDGIAQLWKQKGRPRREAARIYAKIANKHPANVMSFLESAARASDDPSLHPLGVQGLCNGVNAGSSDARRGLARSADDASVEVRQLVIDCVANGPDPAKNGVAIATRLLRDPEPSIRAAAARILAEGASNGNKAAADSLVALADDASREVRVVAIRGLGAFGSAVGQSAGPALARAFERGDDGEKLVLLRTAKQVGAADLMARGMGDRSAAIRVATVQAALSGGLDAEATLRTALADPEAQVRRAALEQLAVNKDKLPIQSIEKALAATVRDTDPEISQLALTTVARLAAKEAVATRLGRALASRTERERAQAAAATIGLVDRDAGLTVQLLEPLLLDPSHDVRVAMLPALAAAYAKTQAPDRLRALLSGTELHAMRRLVIAASFVVLARTPPGAKAATEALKKTSTSGPPLARQMAKLVLGLLESNADGIGFLQKIVP
jgi:HEAT repeat protein